MDKNVGKKYRKREANLDDEKYVKKKEREQRLLGN